MIAFQVSVTATLLLSTLTFSLAILLNQGKTRYYRPTIYSAFAMNVAFAVMLLTMVWL